jgi:hypothetical protein
MMSMVDLGTYEFNDGNNRLSWIQAFPLGTYEHEVYGTIKFTAAKANRMIQNLDQKVRGQELDIDYDHKSSDARAAGWVVAAENRGPGPAGGLWIQVEWTPSAYQALSEGEYRYFSPEFADVWVHPKTQVQYHDVLFGGALTNRPFLKDIMPIQLSELLLGETDQGDASMSEVLKQLAELLGLKDFDEKADSAGETLLGEVTKLKEAKAKGPEPDPDGGDGDDEDEQLRKLSESNPAIAKLLADRETDRKALMVLERAHRLSEVTLRLGELKTEKWMLPPAFTDTIRAALVQMPVKLSDTVLDAIGDLTKTGLVPLSVPSGGGRGDPPETDPVKAFTDKIDALMNDKKMSYGDAAKFLSEHEPELWGAYEGAVLVGTREEG